ncbi:beta-hydroxyacyl-ACP dehydratase [Pedobacter frigidisoli]|uniref:Beta-hydroxyacyl-ACP dehydratase n=1 Tax=Pedobacter frigidisoli TaxID=2530455 RepID=A0A4R0P4Q0_9SPHI|nr:beta-hydroxyacyl-ACP dehydratase [Pedobacter frigidisoli]TCD10200.1 beta-hydroxyacyl-ACP dehydratase [Pedobacter frigidisoli]
MSPQEILKNLPYGQAFLFVDELLQVNEFGAKGTYTFDENLAFYSAHFKDEPITPAVILTETMAQIGLVCLGLYLTKEEPINKTKTLAMSSSSIDFLRPVYPGEKVWVTSEKIYFRFNKLSCRVKMESAAGEMICKGTISGMLIAKPHE